MNVYLFKLTRAADVVAVSVRRGEGYRQVGELFGCAPYVAKARAAVYQQSLFAADDKITEGMKILGRVLKEMRGE